MHFQTPERISPRPPFSGTFPRTHASPSFPGLCQGYTSSISLTPEISIATRQENQTVCQNPVAPRSASGALEPPVFPIKVKIHLKNRFKNWCEGIPIVEQQKWIRLGSMRIRVRFLASLSGLRIRHSRELWCRSQTWLGCGEAGMCSFDWTLNLEISCLRLRPKNKKKKKNHHY